MRAYVIKQGDYLAKIAHSLGFSADEVWSHPRNADLKQLRDPNLLLPGDVLFIPDPAAPPLGITGGSSNDYSAEIPTTTVTVFFKNLGKPRANERYVITGLGEAIEGTTDAEGKVEITVSVHLREVDVAFPDDYAIYGVRVGDMDPIDEPSGARKRLQHLGYYDWAADQPLDASLGEDELEGANKAAILAYQQANGLEATGVIDVATRAALEEHHGS